VERRSKAGRSVSIVIPSRAPNLSSPVHIGVSVRRGDKMSSSSPEVPERSSPEVPPVDRGGEEAKEELRLEIVEIPDKTSLEPEQLLTALPTWCSPEAKQFLTLLAEYLTIEYEFGVLRLQLPNWVSSSPLEYRGEQDTLKALAFIEEFYRYLTETNNAALSEFKTDMVFVIGQAQSCLERALLNLYHGLRETEKDIENLEAQLLELPTMAKGDIIDTLERYFESKYHFVRTEEGTLYCWNPETRIYEECEKKIKRELREIAKLHNVRDKITRYVVNEVISYIKDLSYRSYKELESSRYIIATSNGWAFDVKTWIETGTLKVFRPTPEYFIRHRISAEFHQSKFEKAFELLNSGKVKDWLELGPILCPKIHKTFTEWVRPEDVRTLYEIIGYTLYPRYSIHKMIMLVGEGGNGKTTYANLIKRFLGNENVSARDLQSLAEYQFSRIDLVGKLANIFVDLPKKPLKETGVIKALTGEDTIIIDIKHRPRGFEYENYAKMIFTANELPPVFDQSLGWWRRWIVIEFPNKFLSEDELEGIPEEKRKELIERKRIEFLDSIATKDELSGLLVMSLLAVRDLIKRGSFSTRGDFKTEWLRRVDSVFDFLVTLEKEGIEKDGKLYKLIRDKEGKILRDTFHDLYAYFVREYRDATPLDKGQFTIRLKRYGITKKKSGGKHYYKGARLETKILGDGEESEEESEDWRWW